MRHKMSAGPVEGEVGKTKLLQCSHRCYQILLCPAIIIVQHNISHTKHSTGMVASVQPNPSVHSMYSENRTSKPVK